jgi:hypothetical protein
MRVGERVQKNGVGLEGGVEVLVSFGYDGTCNLHELSHLS